MKEPQFSLEKDILDDKKRDVYLKHLFSSTRSGKLDIRKQAKKDIEKLYNTYTNAIRSADRGKYRKQSSRLFPVEIIKEHIDSYYSNNDADIKQAIVSSLYFPVLVLTPDYISLFEDLLCDAVTHSSGNVRKMTNSLGFWISASSISLDNPLAYHPDTNNSRDENLPQSAQDHLRIIEHLLQLIEKYNKEDKKPAHWIDLKPSVYKSLFVLLSEVARNWPDYTYNVYQKQQGVRHGLVRGELGGVVDDKEAKKLVVGFKDEQYVWDEQSGVVAGQTMPDGTFLGTGLGGFGQKLRFLMYIPIDLEDKPIAEAKKEIIKNHLFNGLFDIDAAVEDIIFTKTYIQITLLIDWEIAPQTVFDLILIGLYKAMAPVRFCFFAINTEKPSEEVVNKELNKLLEHGEEMDMEFLSDKLCFDFVFYDKPIANLQQMSRRDEFMDERRADDHFSYVMENAYVGARAYCLQLRGVLAADPYFLDTYAILAEVYEERKGKNHCDPEGFVAEAYRRACLLIADKDGDWPKYMDWSWYENRHIMRALAGYAYLVWKKGRVDIALDIFRRLLRMNPNDNQGARYEILALRLGWRSDWHAKFLAKDAPAPGLIDAREINEWFQLEAKKFPEEFKVFWSI